MATATLERRGRRIRSERANAYYWAAVVTPLFVELHARGEADRPEDVHEMLKERFLSVEHVDPDTGEVRMQPLSTTALHGDEFFEYVRHCRDYALGRYDVVTEEPRRWAQRQ